MLASERSHSPVQPRTTPSADVDPSGRPRRSRGGRGRGRSGRPTPATAAPEAAPATAQARPATLPASAPGTAGQSFADLGVPAPLVAVLTSQGILTPFPIQTATLPDTFAGRDVLGRGKTGSGKTLAFSIPVVSRLLASGAPKRPNRPRALILVPTRELASQVAATLQPLAAAVGLNTATIFGGVGQGPQVSKLRGGLDILIACPGRLEDLIGQGHCDLGSIEISVLDEADHMADLGFLPVVKRILDRTPKGGQRLLFSATLDNGVDVLVRRYLPNPVTHSVDPVDTHVSTMVHHVFAVSHDAKNAVVRELASGQGRSLLFTRTKRGARRLARSLTEAGIPAADLHGNLAQAARERNLAQFTAGTVRVLVATDIAARGVHVDDIELVVHVDPPAEPKAYLHRSGRTARAGADGVVVTVMTPDQEGDVRTLARQAGIRPTTTRIDPGAPQIVALTGPPAEFVTPAPAPPVQSGGGNGGGGRGRGGNGNAGRPRGSGNTGGRGGAQRSGGSRSSASPVKYSSSTPGAGAVAASRRAPRRGRAA